MCQYYKTEAKGNSQPTSHLERPAGQTHNIIPPYSATLIRWLTRHSWHTLRGMLLTAQCFDHMTRLRSSSCDGWEIVDDVTRHCFLCHSVISKFRITFSILYAKSVWLFNWWGFAFILSEGAYQILRFNKTMFKESQSFVLFCLFVFPLSFQSFIITFVVQGIMQRACDI